MLKQAITSDKQSGAQQVQPSASPNNGSDAVTGQNVDKISDVVSQLQHLQKQNQDQLEDVMKINSAQTIKNIDIKLDEIEKTDKAIVQKASSVNEALNKIIQIQADLVKKQKEKEAKGSEFELTIDYGDDDDDDEKPGETKPADNSKPDDDDDDDEAATKPKANYLPTVTAYNFYSLFDSNLSTILGRASYLVHNEKSSVYGKKVNFPNTQLLADEISFLESLVARAESRLDVLG